MYKWRYVHPLPIIIIIILERVDIITHTLKKYWQKFRGPWYYYNILSIYIYKLLRSIRSGEEEVGGRLNSSMFFFLHVALSLGRGGVFHLFPRTPAIFCIHVVDVGILKLRFTTSNPTCMQFTRPSHHSHTCLFIGSFLRGIWLAEYIAWKNSQIFWIIQTRVISLLQQVRQITYFQIL